MRSFRLHLAAAAGLFRRDATVYFSYRWRLVTQHVGVLFSLAIFFYISDLVRVPAFASPGSYFAYAAVGVIILQVLQSTLDVPTTVRQELVAGTFERMAVSPFGPVAGSHATRSGASSGSSPMARVSSRRGSSRRGRLLRDGGMATRS